MKKEMMKPVIIVLSLVSVFAIVFVIANNFAFAGAREDVVLENEVAPVDVVPKVAEASEEVEETDEFIGVEANATVEPSEFDRYVEVPNSWGGVWYWRVYSEEGVYERRIKLDGEFVRFYAEGFVLPEEYSSFSDFIDRMPRYEIRVGADLLFDRGLPFLADIPYAREDASLPEMTFVMEDFTRWNIVSSFNRHVDSFILQEHHLSFEQVAALVAVGIYSEFGESIDGLEGSMHFIGHGSGFEFPNGAWFGSILDASRTEHNMGDELFIFMIDAVSGEIINVDMTTPENPWFG